MESVTILSKTDNNQIIDLLKAGKVGMLPSDTLYGLSCLALDINAVEKIYQIKNRDNAKPFIVLIHSIEDLEDFGILLSYQQKEFLKYNWPNKLTVVLECPNNKVDYIHRGKKSIGFRMPNDTWIQNILTKTGPIISTTVNISGEKSLTTVQEAIKTFGTKIDFYVDAGLVESLPSTIIKLFASGEYEILREGSVRVNARQNG